jgi:hypothetical protein
MYTLLLSLGAGALGFLLGTVAVGWWAGFVPALLLFALSFFLISRQVMAKVQLSFGEAQKLAANPPPQEVVRSQDALLAWQAEQRKALRAAIKEALAYEKWQFLVREQVYSQLGMLDYQEGIEARMMKRANAAETSFQSARDNLEKAWSPRLSPLLKDWRSRALLASVHHRASRPEDAHKVLQEGEQAGSGEPLYFGLWAFILQDAKRGEDALQVVARGLKNHPTSQTLQKVQEAISNKRKPDMSLFGESWYQFFPEDIPMEKRMEMAKAMGIDPAAQTAANRPIPRHTWPQHPRR